MVSLEEFESMVVDRLILIVEGETEEMFVDNLLSPHLYSIGFQGSVVAIKPKKTRGGLSKYSDVSKQLKSVICEHGAVVSTIFDFYKLPNSFPGYSNGTNHYEQVLNIERAMLEDMQKSLARDCRNFIPHIQLHEFETLVFSDVRGLDAIYDVDNNEEYKAVRDLILSTENPETINNGAKTAPSKRLLKIVGYNKIIQGKTALEEIGMERMLSKCPHFREWVEKLVQLLTPNIGE
jgi:hypothetical protein